MNKLESHISKDAAWRSRWLRHAHSGKTIAAFCRDVSVSTASFHIATYTGRQPSLCRPCNVQLLRNTSFNGMSPCAPPLFGWLEQ
jgi:hypothetical protein